MTRSCTKTPLRWSHLLISGFSLFWGGLSAFSEQSVEEAVETASLIRYAQNFSIESHEDYKIVSVMHAYEGAGDKTFRYALYPRGNNKPDVSEVDAFVEVPIKRAIVLSTTFLAAIDVVGGVDSLVGVGNFNYVNTPSVVEKIDAGSLVQVGSETMKNIELMVSLEPEVIFANIVGSSDYDVHPTLNKMGIVSAVTAAYMERSLLARAEWVKFVGVFYGEDAKATEHFNTIEKQYLKLKSLANGVSVRPTVFANAPWGNIWYVPSGTSYVAGLIKDAGANYLWNDITTEGSFPMDFESVYERAIDADFWVNSGYLNTMDAIAAQDERYLEFNAMKTGNVFSETLRESAKGGNDIWERGFIHPEEILADFIKIFHPEILPEHEFVYYKRVQ